MPRRRLRVALLIGVHLLLSGMVAASFVRQFGQGWLAIGTHVVVLAEWDALILAAIREDRQPKEQGRRLIVDGLRRAGYLDPDPDAPAPARAAAEADGR